ncbi:hypothetical protein D3C86_1520920 [compost metagenome]
MSVIKHYRRKLQHGGDPPGPANLEAHFAYLGQGLGEGIFPGDAPVRRFGLPTLGRGTFALAQDDSVAGKGLGRAVPALTPAFGVGEGVDRLVKNRGIRKAQLMELGDAIRQVRRAFRPLPDKQADSGGLFGAQPFASHQAGDRGACVEAAGPGLHVIGQAPVEFALHQQVQRLGQLLGDSGHLAC